MLLQDEAEVQQKKLQTAAKQAQEELERKLDEMTRAKVCPGHVSTHCLKEAATTCNLSFSPLPAASITLPACFQNLLSRPFEVNVCFDNVVRDCALGGLQEKAVCEARQEQSKLEQGNEAWAAEKAALQSEVEAGIASYNEAIVSHLSSPGQD